MADPPAPRPRPRVPHENEVFARRRTRQDQAADAVTAFAGTLTFVYIHAVWFAGWIAINLGLLGAALVFDEFPFGLLTMVVSLEAIFLSTFVMVSQNRQAARENTRADLDFETNVRAEVWSVHLGRSLGLDPEAIERRVQEIVTQNRAAIRGEPNEPVDPRSL
ncbi:MAG: DUF1003 domain-containing protein [Nocardioidaceae bacterium]